MWVGMLCGRTYILTPFLSLRGRQGRRPTISILISSLFYVLAELCEAEPGGLGASPQQKLYVLTACDCIRWQVTRIIVVIGLGLGRVFARGGKRA